MNQQQRASIEAAHRSVLVAAGQLARTIAANYRDGGRARRADEAVLESAKADFAAALDAATGPDLAARQRRIEAFIAAKVGDVAAIADSAEYLARLVETFRPLAAKYADAIEATDA